MLKDDIIEPALGPLAAPVVIVQKPSREPRFCVDYRSLNQLTVSYKLQRIDKSLDFLARATFISIALARGYWQVAVDESSRSKTAFCFTLCVVPFELCNAHVMFQKLMSMVLAGLV